MVTELQRTIGIFGWVKENSITRDTLIPFFKRWGVGLVVIIIVIIKILYMSLNVHSSGSCKICSLDNNSSVQLLQQLMSLNKFCRMEGISHWATGSLTVWPNGWNPSQGFGATIQWNWWIISGNNTKQSITGVTNYYQILLIIYDTIKLITTYQRRNYFRPARTIQQRFSLWKLKTEKDVALMQQGQFFSFSTDVKHRKKNMCFCHNQHQKWWKYH